MVLFRDGKVLVCLLLLIISPQSLRSEETLIEVNTYLSRNAVHPGEEFKLALRVSIKNGWHINANKVEDEFLIPTTLTLDAALGLHVIEFCFPKPKRGRFTYSESEQPYYRGEVLFGARVQADADVLPGKSELSAKLTYQACDDRSCTPPRTISLSIPVEVVPATQETRDTHPEIFARIQFAKSEGSGP